MHNVLLLGQGLGQVDLMIVEQRGVGNNNEGHSKTESIEYGAGPYRARTDINTFGEIMSGQGMMMYQREKERHPPYLGVMMCHRPARVSYAPPRQSDRGQNRGV